MVYVHLAEGFEEVEALTCVDVLRRADIKVQTVSITGEKTVMGTHGIPVVADILYEEADYPSCEMIVLPGGLPGADHLEAHEGLAKHICCFAKDAANKKLAAICAAPQVFGSCGILEGKKATIYPGMEDELIDAVPTAGNVVKSGNLITSKGPGTAMDFALALIAELKGEEKAAEIQAELIYRQ